MRRRTFLKNTAATGIAAAGAAAAASYSAPLLMGMENKSGSKNVVIGKGEYQYECIHGWGELPRHIQWETTHGVTIDDAGLIYITHQGHGQHVMDTTVVFDPAGKYVRSFAKRHLSRRPRHRLAQREWRRVSVHVRHRPSPGRENRSKGDVVWKLGYPKEPGVYKNKSQYRPTNVAFAPDGGFYIADGYGSNYIHQYDKDTQWVRTWGGTGKEPGKFQTPHGIWLDDRPAAKIARRRRSSQRPAAILHARRQVFEHCAATCCFPAHFDIRGDVLLRARPARPSFAVRLRTTR